MSNTRKYDWPALLNEFSESGLTQTKFCRERGINAKYFSLQRAKRLKENQPAFVKVEVATPPQKNQSLVLKFSHAELCFDTSIDPRYISQLIKASS